MQSNFAECNNLLRVADQMLRSLSEQDNYLDNHIAEQLVNLTTTFEHHSGVLALYTNRPLESIKHLLTHKEMLESHRSTDRLKLDGTWGTALNELGNAYLQNKNPTFAEECYRFSLESLNDVASTDTNTLTMPQINLGFCLWLQGRLEEAALEFDEVMQQRELVYQKDDTVSSA